MSFAGRAAALALRAWCAPRAAAFQRHLADVAGSQRRTLRRILIDTAHTSYSRSLTLSGKEDLEAFRAAVPIVDYRTLDAWIDVQRREHIDALAPGPVRCYEPTSGSAGAVKYIPYNTALLRSFRALFMVWAHDLLTHVLQLRSGRIFMSISPQFGAPRGLTDDREYLGAGLRALLARFLVMPDERPVSTIEEFRTALARALLLRKDLEVISVWNPSYLLLLLEHIETQRELLLPMLPRHRRKPLARTRVDWGEVWPDLQLVSCWTAAAAAAPARKLAARFTNVTLQGKGLLATEAPMTVPLTRAGGCVPLADEVFFELEEAAGKLLLLHEAQPGRIYSLIITQAGGLLRYRIGDRVQVTGRYRDAPLLAFVGRDAATADLVGEKLTEDFVAQQVQAVAAADAFCVLLPIAGDRPHYHLLTDDATPGLARRLDEALRGAVRYGEARALEQLGELRSSVRHDMRNVVHAFFIGAGMAAGDIKDRALLADRNLAQRLRDAQALERIET